MCWGIRRWPLSSVWSDVVNVHPCYTVGAHGSRGGGVSYSVLLSSPGGWSCRISSVIHFHFHTSRWSIAQ